jgi:hypothetical protein
MTIPELLKTLRAMLPDEYRVTVELETAQESKSAEPSVQVRIFASTIHKCEMEEGDTCEQALARFKANVLPGLGLTEEPASSERLAEMGV